MCGAEQSRLFSSAASPDTRSRNVLSLGRHFSPKSVLGSSYVTGFVSPSSEKLDRAHIYQGDLALALAHQLLHSAFCMPMLW